MKTILTCNKTSGEKSRNISVQCKRFFIFSGSHIDSLMFGGHLVVSAVQQSYILQAFQQVGKREDLTSMAMVF